MNFNAIQSQQSVQQQSMPLTLREGQVFHGSIKQLFPNQVAEVQVGANKLVAKLETPLKAGDSHYFQVTSTKGQVELKVVTGPMTQASPAQQMTQLMDSMNLPKTTEMRQVMTHFLKHHLPMSKEQLVHAEAWMKAMPDRENKAVALQAMTRMIDLKMPFTNDVFQALIHGSKPFGLSANVANLMQQLMQDTHLNSTIKSNLINQIELIQKPLAEQVGGNLLANATNALLDTNASMANKLQILSLLKQSNVVNANATLSNWHSSATNFNTTMQANYGQFVAQIANSGASNVAQASQHLLNTIAQDNTLSSEQKQQLQSTITRFIQLDQSQNSIQTFAKQIGEQLIKIQANNQLTRPSMLNEQNIAPKDQLLSLLRPEAQIQQHALTQLAQTASQSQVPFLQAMVADAESLVQSNMDSRQIEQAMKSVLRSLGLNYEPLLASSKADQLDTISQSLKPQLLNLLQDGQLPTPIRDAAETLLARVNGMQLLSTDNGHQHQIVMQVPLDFLGKRMDATLHWNGRMKDDGKIDSNFARVLFYLQMESIEETVIDMQVQNRIVSITVFNENDNLQPLATALNVMLANGLEEKGYQLSGVQIKSFEQQTTSSTKVANGDEKPHSGVDIRI